MSVIFKLEANPIDWFTYPIIDTKTITESIIRNILIPNGAISQISFDNRQLTQPDYQNEISYDRNIAFPKLKLFKYKFPKFLIIYYQVSKIEYFQKISDYFANPDTQPLIINMHQSDGYIIPENLNMYKITVEDFKELITIPANSINKINY